MEIKIKTSLTEYNYSNVEHVSNLIGTIDNNVINYMDEAVNVSIIKNDNCIVLKRQAKDYIIELDFNILKGSILLLDSNTSLPLEIEIKHCVIEDNKINIKYLLNTSPNIMHFKLEYEVIYES